MVSYEPIGVVRSPFHERAGMPLQSIAAAEVHGQVEIEPAYAPGLRDVPAFDAFEAERTGWLDKGARRVHEVRADQ